MLASMWTSAVDPRKNGAIVWCAVWFQTITVRDCMLLRGIFVCIDINVDCRFSTSVLYYPVSTPWMQYYVCFVRECLVVCLLHSPAATLCVCAVQVCRVLDRAQQRLGSNPANSLRRISCHDLIFQPLAMKPLPTAKLPVTSFRGVWDTRATRC